MPRGENHLSEVRALGEGRAYVDLSSWRKALVAGPEAASWLNDLVSASVADLRPGEARRSLLLSPTGRIRADFLVAWAPEGLVLLQDPVQPRAVAALLAPYVLSSQVTVEDRTASLALFAVPGASEVPHGLPGHRPSALGEGADALVPAARRGEAVTALGTSLVEASPEAVEAWRVLRGLPRLAVDFGEDALPPEVGLEGCIDFAKGCFLGQEAVARVRNLGRPRWVLLSLRTPASVSPGDRVLADGREVGTVTSATAAEGWTAVLARVRWEARQAALRTPSGTDLLRAGAPATP